MVMAYLIKTQPIDIGPDGFHLGRVRSMYGGDTAAVGDEVFLWFSETQGGAGLYGRGVIQILVREGGLSDIGMAASEIATKPLANEILIAGMEGEPGSPLHSLTEKLYKNSHNKIVALSPEEAEYLAGHFQTDAAINFNPLAAPPYAMGQVYNRRKDIHKPFGGQERGGIATPKSCNWVFLFTGEQGEGYGYQDGLRADGIFEYTGEGQVGDMQFLRGNSAVLNHTAAGKQLLLFEAQKQKGLYRFLGSYICQGYDNRVGIDREGNERQIIVFHLSPLDSEPDEIDAGPPQKTTEELRALAYQVLTPRKETASVSSRQTYFRSMAVRDYVLSRANGTCECCDKPAPFVRKDGSPYLEPHHTTRLADKGFDHPRWVAAICPNCHRHIHYGKSGDDLNQTMRDKLSVIEPA